MNNLFRRLKKFFFPPIGTPRWLRIMPYAALGVLTLLALTSGAYAWEYTNSPEFCGTACHTMPPEYTAYLTSPHARVDCVECHIGRGFIATRITRKAGDAKHIISLLFKHYEFPITAGELRPARETCELCHFPEKFSDDSLREIRQFGNDKNNTPYTIYLVLKTGGGSSRLGLGRGIHWHIENPVYFYATDHDQQEIPYIKVIGEDGEEIEYIDVETDFDPSTISPDDLEELDCITCHNRITHLVPHPEDMIDELLRRGQVSPEIPEIRKRAVDTFYAEYESKQIGLNAIKGLEGYYQTYYSDFYAENAEVIKKSIGALVEAYDNSVYPEQKSDWNSHNNNIGHLYTPGCFRCHDGKHLNDAYEAIRLECNVCHSIPVVAGPSDFVADIEVSRGIEPASHFNSNWISLHHVSFDQSCQSCHTTEDAGGTSNVSFCSNSACHGIAWNYAGFDAPALREILLSQQPAAAETPPPSEEGETGEEVEASEITYATIIGPLLGQRCGACHGPTAMKGLNLTTYESTLAGGESGTAIVPGEPESSLLVQIQSGEQQHFGQLSPDELDTLVEWIAAGAPE